MARAPQASCGYCEQKIQPETSFCSSCGYPTPWATTEDRTRWEVSQWQRYSEKSSESRPQAARLVSVRPQVAPAAQTRPVEEAVRVQTRPVPVLNGKPTVKPVPKAARPAESEPPRRPALEPVRHPVQPELELEVETIVPELELEIVPEKERVLVEPELELEEPVLEAIPDPGHEPAASLSELTGAVGKLRTLFQRLQGESGVPRPIENGSVSSEEGDANAAPAPWTMPQAVARPIASQPVAQPSRTVQRATPVTPPPVEPQRPKAAQGQAASRSRDAAKAQPVPRPPRQRRDPNEKLLSDTVQVLRQLSATMNEMAGALRVAQENQRRSIFRRNH